MKESIRLHELWLKGDPRGIKAMLRGFDLRGEDLRGVNLERAELGWTKLEMVDLACANLKWADLICAKLEGVNLKRANLEMAALRGANLERANFEEANLRLVSLRGANLKGANLKSAHLQQTELEGANLQGANLEDTVLDPEATWTLPTPEEVREAGMEVKGGIIQAWRTAKSRHCGETEYTPGVYEAPYFSHCSETVCHPGLYFASFEWLKDHYYSDLSLVSVTIRLEDVIHVSDKWRAKKFIVQGATNG